MNSDTTRYSLPDIVIDGSPLAIEDVIALAEGRDGDFPRVVISDEKEFRQKLQRSRQHLQQALDDEVPVYGVSTGFGKGCGKRIPRERQEELGRNLIRYHGCGTGERLSVAAVRAAMLARIQCFAQGFSGVRYDLLTALADLLNHQITPIVPSQGSVGASGDLTPMSYIAAVLTGERRVILGKDDGPEMDAAEALKQAGLAPLVFEQKEPLAMINGTPIMTGIAALAVDRARKVAQAALAGSALSVHALGGHRRHFHPSIAKAKPHPGQRDAAAVVYGLLQESSEVFEASEPGNLQDPYSLRCTPQVVGVLYDTLAWATQWVEIEFNSANDNPLFDPETGEVLTSGNFYGGHITQAMDSLKAALASVGDLCDRQVAMLVDERFSRGLPADLVPPKDDGLHHHGFKGLQITASALAAEALKLTMPAGSFSRSTESHNQDKVSMGTIAARDCTKICEYVEKICAIHLMTAVQACRLRGRTDARPGLTSWLRSVEAITGHVAIDRPLDEDIDALAAWIRAGKSTGIEE